MKCPKCNYDNPSGIRYCLRCNSSLIPPIPQEQNSQQPQKSDQKLIPIVIAIIVIVVLMAIVALSIMSIFIGRMQVSRVMQHAVTEYSEETTDYADLSNRLLFIPGSDLVIEFPEYVDYVYDYSQETDQLLFEIKTYDNLTITFTSSPIDAGYYTKSETQNSLQQNGLDYLIEGSENEYYYILPSKNGTVYGTIIDSYSDHLVNITVVDNDYVENELPDEYSESEGIIDSTIDSQQSMINESDQSAQEDLAIDDPNDSKLIQDPNQTESDLCLLTLEKIMESTDID